LVVLVVEIGYLVKLYYHYASSMKLLVCIRIMRSSFKILLIRTNKNRFVDEVRSMSFHSMHGIFLVIHTS